ncbi:cleavage and polyadenylation specificity factor subunit 2 isoform X1 [Selaginella moellendorffii]|uniref:cleavage and polyadenylation specificity factor subunit 2 isoform X1 n=1 Tax=Selaginella moellendorffii TaxID=88036 RepID=UPI000D1CE6AA|nr:cleavage and polyadenylation specificity factor subunit 2 isoform X1 [Selaginella moellendorffii]XP_024532305.1 cleavage and polyadenylation specificity factor subunit 2 isoform X1 [Selaginella moellendorffii]|eukprot:XP_024532304.1 cleavage and polyadenylation specificity factor subunit 2 isoform X1 [Selaginella moellendorffii]
MGTSVQLTPLAGAHSEGPLCYLLQVDDFRFLLDCGWNDVFDVSLLQPLVSVAPTIDAVLLSHSDTLHLGALPYAIAKLGLNATVYCTHPIRSMGHMQMYDHCLSRTAVSHFDLFSLDDVDTAFSNTCPLKYSQHFPLQGKGQGITITPFPAARLLGGTIWKITKDTEDIIYAVDFNHRKERHLNATVLESFTRPAVLITDAYNALNSQPVRRQRDQEFLDIILRTLRSSGNVLLPVEPSGRVLEIILYLDQHWSQHRINVPLVFLTYVVGSVTDFVKSSLEWMNDAIGKAFEQNRENPFALRSVKLCTSRKQLDELPPGPRVVLASMASLETGFAKELFLEWAVDPKNLVLFTERAQVGTLARQLQVEPPPKIVKITISKKVLLVGEELEAYEREQSRLREEARNAASQQEPVQPASSSDDLMPSAPDESSTPSEGKQQAVTVHHDIFIDGFTVPADTVAPMFPVYDDSNERDEYGEIINPDDFVIKEEFMDYSQTQAVSDVLSASKTGFNDLFFLQNANNIKLETEGDTSAEKPSKVVTTDTAVVPLCALTFMDFEGRADGRSIKSILAHVAPLKLVLIHGSAESTEHLKQHCLKNVCPFVYTPRVGENMNVTSDLNAYKLRLTERIMSSVLFRKLGDYELAWVDGEIGQNEEDLLPLLPLDGTPPPHKTVFVGDLRLADFKQLLATKGIQAEFAGGVLRCADNIAVRKSGGQQLVIEGSLSDDYYKVRELLYSQYHIV